MIVISGANGRLGRAIVERLLELVPAERIGVSVRDVAAAQDLARRGVRVRHGDFSQPATLAAAFEGAERLLLISTDQVDAQRVQQHRNAVQAAREAGVGQILYTGIFNPVPDSPFVATAHHAATEQAIYESGLDYVILRNSIYLETIGMFVGPALATGVLATPADGPVGYAARADLAEATANLLARGGYHRQALDLTGPEAIDLAGVAALASELSGRPIARQVLSDEEYIAQLVGAGLPRPVGELFTTIFSAMNRGQFAAVSPTLAELLGRPPLDARGLLQGMLVAPQPVA
jgi:NAD(P)H dehydrogenase (quinone)